jgi:site-specific DNA-methyltransferase (adenine-specific)
MQRMLANGNNEMNQPPASDVFKLHYPTETVGRSLLVQADCFEWLQGIPEQSLSAIITDPPYGGKEYNPEQIAKRESGQGGVWRFPPSFDGHERAPLPRFTALSSKERHALRDFFVAWGQLTMRCLRPGAHVFLASNAFLSQLVFGALAESGLEFRGEVLRLVQTLRGGDRPKNAEAEFPDVSSLPRGGYEPWGLFRKPMPTAMRLSDCLREFGTGGLRRLPDGRPFSDVIPSERTPQKERDIAKHPSLKPQSFLRQIVYAALPLGVGVVADPFMGSGSTVAAAEALGIVCVGVERHPDYYQLSRQAVAKLSGLETATNPVVQEPLFT